MSITITPAVGSRRVILRNGGDAGMIERGKAYAQGLTAPELRELADRMDGGGPQAALLALSISARRYIDDTPPESRWRGWSLDELLADLDAIDAGDLARFEGQA